MVQNSCGADSSAAANLVVCLSPQITAQPHDSNIVAGGTASFSVTVLGTNLAYQWQRSTDGLKWQSDTVNGKAAVYTVVGKSADNGTQFQCVVGSKCGSITSSSARLGVCTPDTITASSMPSKSVLVGDTVNFSVTAAGTKLSYAWQKKVTGATAFTAIVDTISSYSLVAQSSDSGSLFRCVVSGQCGTPETTQTGLVQVFVPLHAAFGASATNGQAPLNVQFTDSSTGNFTLRVWDFGDGTKPDSASKNPVHSFATANTYNVKLTVSGPPPLVTSVAQTQVFTWNPGDNPIQMSGTFVLPQKVAYSITNFGTIIPPSPLVSVDSVVLWYKSGGLPQTASSSTYLKGYTLAALKTGGASYRDTATMPPLSGSDTIYGFMTSIRWSDGKLSTFAVGNGTTVLMKDTTPVLNNLLISGVYLPDDTARIYLDNVTSIDTSRVDTVGIWNSLAAGTPNFKDTVATKWVTAKQVFAAGAKWSIDVVNPQFNNVKTTVYAAVILEGINGRMSPVKQTSFTVGKDRPANPIKLVAKTLSSNRIRLTWNNVVSAGVERIMIWYRAGLAVPKAYDFSTLKLDSLVPAVGDTVIIGSQFSPSTKYYFGAQVYKGGLWSYVTDSSSASDSTWAAGAALDSNSCAFTKMYLDTGTNQIRVCWTVDPAQAESLQVGILYSVAGVPVVNTGNQQVVAVTAAKDSAFIKLRENLLFDTTYYASLWLRRPGGLWTYPTMRSIDSVRIGNFTWQPVTYFSKAADTVYAFDNNVRLTNTPGDLSQTSNKLLYVAAPGALAIGLVPTGVGLTFTAKAPGAPFNVGLKVDSLPKGYAIQDVRIYNQTASGLWVISDNPFTVDTVNGYVSVLTNQLGLPFFAMVDTRSPLEKVLGSQGFVAADSSFYDTIRLSDNIANLKWHLLSAKGGSAWSAGDTSQSGELSDTLDTLIVNVPGGSVSPDNGVRAMLVVTDGLHSDTIDLSRSVVLASAGDIHSDIQTWTPLSVTAVLDSPQARNALGFFEKPDGSWKYDNTIFRIFRWGPGGTDGGSWQEYADSIRGRFAFTRGNLTWLKSKTKGDVVFGKGHTPSLAVKETFVLGLAPKSWTDFGLPYKFDMVIGDILAATRAAGGQTDSLVVCAWKKDSKGRFRSTEIFMKALADSLLNNEATVLAISDAAGYTIYNPYADTVMLQIPPVPQPLSTAGLSKRLIKSAAAEGWAVRIAAQLSDSTELSPVYCGFAKRAGSGASFYPASPSFVNSGVRIFDLSAKLTHGHEILHQAAMGGYAFVLSFYNKSSQSETIRYHLENDGVLPNGMQAALFNANTQAFEDMSRGDAAVRLQANSTDFRWLLVGTKDYLAKASIIARPARLALVGTYPNPFRTSVRIRYDLPYEGIDKVKFAIYDLRGRMVWNTELACEARYGTGDVIWNARTADGGPLAAGIYIIRMAAYSQSRRSVGVFERKMTFVP